MAVITFDTLAFSKTLQASGMAKEHADAFAEAQKNAINEMIETKELATKADILRLENKLLERIENNKHEILKWMISSFLAQTALIVAVIAFLR